MVRLLDGAAARDAALVGRLTDLINAVYGSSEHGLWRDGVQRTTRAEVARLIDTRQLAVAVVGGQLAGTVRVRAISDLTGEIGMLATDADYRGNGIGRTLIAFAESHARDHALRTMQLAVLVPCRLRNPSREFLHDWYSRIGYRVTCTIGVDHVRPGLSALLAKPCAFVVYEKQLSPPGSDGPTTGRCQPLLYMAG